MLENVMNFLNQEETPATTGGNQCGASVGGRKGGRQQQQQQQGGKTKKQSSNTKKQSSNTKKQSVKTIRKLSGKTKGGNDMEQALEGLMEVENNIDTSAPPPAASPTDMDSSSATPMAVGQSGGMYEPTSLVVALIILGLRVAVSDPSQLQTVKKSLSGTFSSSKKSSKKTKGGNLNNLLSELSNMMK
jgi:hypothetical protein